MLVGVGLFIILRALTRVESPQRYRPHEPWLYEPERYESIEDRERYDRKRDIKGGGVILIGPIPIVFGSEGKYAVIAITMTILLMVLVLLIMVVGWR